MVVVCRLSRRPLTSLARTMSSDVWPIWSGALALPPKREPACGPGFWRLPSRNSDTRRRACMRLLGKATSVKSGIILALAGYAIYAWGDGIIKGLGGHLSIFKIGFFTALVRRHLPVFPQAGRRAMARLLAHGAAMGRTRARPFRPRSAACSASMP